METLQGRKLAKSNKDIVVNFMALVDENFAGFDLNVTSGVSQGSNSGYFLISQLNENGSTTAAHEYGHLLGYQLSPTDVGGGEKAHASKSEKNFIMTSSRDMNASDRRVNYAEVGRLNTGKGINVNSTTIKLPNGNYVYYNPSPLTNLIFKQ